MTMMAARRLNIGPHMKTDASRAATFSKRKKGLLKKVKELSILCGVDVAVMCHHPQMTGAPPLLWGWPNLESVLSRYKGVAPEEREKRKVDNSTFLHNQVLKVASDAQLLADNNRKYANLLQNSLWDERLNAFSPANLQQLAEQVMRKRNEMGEVLASITASELIQPDYRQFDVPVPHTSAAPSPFMLQDAHNEHVVVPSGSHDLIMPAFSESTFVGATVPIASLCNTPLCQNPPAPEHSIFWSPNSDPDIPGSNSSLVIFTDHHSVFETSPKALGADEMLEDALGPIDIQGQVDMAPTWLCNGMATTPAVSNASETFCSHADAGANFYVNVSPFHGDVYYRCQGNT